MQLELESGVVIESPTEADLSSIDGEQFAILSSEDGTYMQCAEQSRSPRAYVLEYQDGSIQRHYHATDGSITLERVMAAFKKYLNRDPTWKSDFQWERMDLS